MELRVSLPNGQTEESMFVGAELMAQPPLYMNNQILSVGQMQRIGGSGASRITTMTI